jgi:tRNA threonylcarbamoyladenosine biosynthesis protein TsaE
MATEAITRSPEETRALGRAVAAMLRPGDVLLLVGELGAGKTTFVQGLARACGVKAQVRSPTFALMHRYRGSPDVVHVDLYRERDARGLEDLAGEAGAADAITVVEWPRGFAESLWPEAPRIEIEILDAATRRFRLPFPAGTTEPSGGSPVSLS